MTLSFSWLDLWSEVRIASFIWQAVTIAASILLSLLVSRVVVHWGSAQSRTGIVEDNQSRLVLPMLWPIAAFAILAASRMAFLKWQAAPLLTLALPVVGSLALVRLVFYLLRRVFMRNGNAGGLLLAFEKVFAALVWLGLAVHLTGLWPDLIAYLEHTSIPTGRHQTSLLVIIQAIASIGATLILALWLGAVLEERLMKVGTIHSSARLVMARAGRASLILVAILLSLSLAGIDLTVLSVFGGALGVGIGLGLQKIVSSYVSGFVILLERSMAVGDMVSVATFYGQVTQINTRYTVIRSLDGIETVVPNDILISGAVQNHSLSDRKLRVATQVTVAYETDVESILPKLIDAVRGIPRICQDPAPHALLTGFGLNGLELELGFWIEDPENGKGNLLSLVNRSIWRVLNEENIRIPYSQHEIRMATGAPQSTLPPELSSIKQ
ncbi:mechanosensitive ion channel|uniref:mechanosensitive ion channel family protein n=1 Tax=Noviherbaspirillum sp. L7-7A TaxID=2850560 RepID=UPI001C2C4803|nr:mechanosensitive ion channel domain-containing protein [Noviherbaspirillum sp. L7-7A]MBV0879648.1 mechanosensitive ion channel [Noviherbaspirillum sp. L7-7A]